MTCRAGAQGLSTLLTRELNCTHHWPQHLSFVRMQSLFFLPLQHTLHSKRQQMIKLCRWIQMEGTRPSLSWGFRVPILWLCSIWCMWIQQEQRRVMLVCMGPRWGPVWPSSPSQVETLTSSSGLTKLNKLLIGNVMMSPKVRVQVSLPAARHVIT